MKPARLDRRTEKTRSALLAAFRELIQAGSFENLTVADIAARAKVSRSTFYAHFNGKDGMLSSSVAWPFNVLSDTVLPADNTQPLVQLLEHFWMNRALARSIFFGPTRRRTVAVLVEQVEAKLKAGGVRRNVLILPLRLTAVQLAEGLLGPVIAWLMGESRCQPETLAMALRRSTRASLAALGSLNGGGRSGG